MQDGRQGDAECIDELADGPPGQVHHKDEVPERLVHAAGLLCTSGDEARRLRRVQHDVHTCITSNTVGVRCLQDVDVGAGRATSMRHRLVWRVRSIGDGQLQAMQIPVPGVGGRMHAETAIMES